MYTIELLSYLKAIGYGPNHITDERIILSRDVAGLGSDVDTAKTNAEISHNVYVVAWRVVSFNGVPVNSTYPKECYATFRTI